MSSAQVISASILFAAFAGWNAWIIPRAIDRGGRLGRSKREFARFALGFEATVFGVIAVIILGGTLMTGYWPWEPAP